MTDQQLRDITAKERVENELEELSEKIVKLSKVLFSKKLNELGISEKMAQAMHEQLDCMEGYAKALQRRLYFWDKTDAEIQAERNGSVNGIRLY